MSVREQTHGENGDMQTDTERAGQNGACDIMKRNPSTTVEDNVPQTSNKIKHSISFCNKRNANKCRHFVAFTLDTCPLRNIEKNASQGHLTRSCCHRPSIPVRSPLPQRRGNPLLAGMCVIGLLFLLLSLPRLIKATAYKVTKAERCRRER